MVVGLGAFGGKQRNTCIPLKPQAHAYDYITITVTLRNCGERRYYILRSNTIKLKSTRLRDGSRKLNGFRHIKMKGKTDSVRVSREVLSLKETNFEIKPWRNSTIPADPDRNEP